MDSHRNTEPGRRALSYSLEGLSARDSVLFKSLVRLLDHLTSHQWIYRPPSADYRVDLLVVAEWFPPTVYRHMHSARQPVLSIGKGPDRDMCLAWPVQPQRLQAVLNQIGNIAQLHHMDDGQSPFMTVLAQAPASGLDDSRQLFRLKQWPPSKYLAGIGRMRMATLLTGRAMSMSELQQRSTLSITVCRAFVSDLQNANLLILTFAETAQPAASTALPHELLNLPSSAEAFARPGLFARIRASLGIKTAHNS